MQNKKDMEGENNVQEGNGNAAEMATENTDIGDVVETKPKSRLAERLSGIEKFKDKSYENEDDAVSDAIALIDDLEASSKEGADFLENIKKTIDEYPIVGHILTDIKKTGSIQASLQSLFDNAEDMLLREGDEGYDIVQERLKKRAEQSEIDEGIKQNWEKNMADFPATFEAWAEQKGIDEAEQENFSAFIGDFMTKLVTGEIKNEELDKLWDSYKYNDDVSELKEDLGVSKANEVPAEKKPDALLPMPASTTPAQQTKAEEPNEKVDPLTEIYNSGMLGKK